MDKHLHIITHEVPWPADYGGVFDLFHKIKSLHSIGIKIHLHCFSKTSNSQPMLNKFCETVEYYPRKKHYSFLNIGIPYIVQSRSDERLLINLKKDNYPILMEGIHCTFFYKKLSSNRKLIVRLHNVECNYYHFLAQHESNLLKKIYFKTESLLLKRYERQLAKTAEYWSVSKLDETFYKKNFSTNNISFLPVFNPWSSIKSATGTGQYCLYHGNLSINENEKAAIWLLQEVFDKLKIPFVIAGNRPSKKLKKLVHSYTHTCIVENPNEHELEDLIRKAQINILPSFNKTGVKLKILNALINGRHCIVNNNAIEGSELSTYCHIANDSFQFQEEIVHLFNLPFTEKDARDREKITQTLYNNAVNAEKINEWLY